MTGQHIEVRPAEWPQDREVAIRLLTGYFAWLAANPAVPESIRSIDRAPELALVPQRYDRQSSTLLIAWMGTEAVGCAAVHRLAAPPRSAEMKRLYVAPGARGCGTGAALIQASAATARQFGAFQLLLDTLPAAMPNAVRLYQSLGFEPFARYNRNLGPEFAFFRLRLG
ncbi:GNAT family N-acetyltransferase [Terriglobus aquaticus]|uniref:GNAT family N-acetyltransferase n=1 Tax=Terriglobus aquaticus TaxID=940139 RepID=A0ABW9KIP8_9BACT|nr:GNAT family N-acetyltransferase [Terriglobus aquaticus]